MKTSQVQLYYKLEKNILPTTTHEITQIYSLSILSHPPTLLLPPPLVLRIISENQCICAHISEEQLSAKPELNVPLILLEYI